MNNTISLLLASHIVNLNKVLSLSVVELVTLYVADIDGTIVVVGVGSLIKISGRQYNCMYRYMGMT